MRCSKLSMMTLCGAAFLLSLAQSTLSARSATAGPAPANPVKVTVRSPQQSVHVGEKPAIEISLQNASNQPAKAPIPLTLDLEVRLPSGKVQSSVVTLNPNESSKTIRIPTPVTETGIAEIRAKSRQLLDGNTYVFVKPRQKADVQAPYQPTSKRRSERLLLDEPFEDRYVIRLAASASSPAALESIPHASAPHIELRTGPPERRLANGKDAVWIEAFYTGAQGAPQDIRVHLSYQDLIIPKGQFVSTRAPLTATEAETVTVKYLGSSPEFEFQGDRVVTFSFGPPITHIEVKASPRSLTLLDTSSLIIRLLDDDGRPIETDRPRAVAFAIDSGRGVFDPEDFSIPKDQAIHRTRFLPTRWGTTVVSASTPNLLADTEELQVEPPVWQVMLVVIGSLLGGLIAYQVSAKRRRIAIGVITGCVLYWAYVVGVLALPSLPRGIVSHPASALCLPLLGGFLGISALTPILRWLGLARGDGSGSAQSDPSQPAASRNSPRQRG